MMRALIIAALLAAPGLAQAQEAPATTRIMVRAVSHDAKIIGSAVGGAQIVITDATTGAMLAQGVQRGGTGETARIVTQPRVRGEAVYDTDGAAGFLAELALERPTVVDITATAPLGTPEALMRTTKRMLLIPGKDVLGDGVVLELNGLTVRLLAPQTGAAEIPAGAPLDVRVNATMLCGCPTSPDGTWDSNGIEIIARLQQDGRTVAQAPLIYAGQTSTYAGALPAPAPGRYALEVIASQTAQGNFGMASETLTVR